MKISIIILLCNSERCIGTLIKSVLRTLAIKQVEWIIIDNGSVDRSPEIVQDLLQQAILITNRTNLGVAVARNMGIKASTGQYLLFLDDDTEVLPDAIDSLCEFLDKEPQCAMVAPQLLNIDGSFQANALPVPVLTVKCNRIIRKLLGKKLPNPYINKIKSQEPFHPGYLIGACQLIRHHAVNQTGLLDEKIFYGPEDADYCLRLKSNGFSVACLPTAQVIHAYRQQTSKLKNVKLVWYHFKGLVYFWWKYRNITF